MNGWPGPGSRHATTATTSSCSPYAESTSTNSTNSHAPNSSPPATSTVDGIDIAGHQFAVGDRVMALNNRRALGIVNGDRGTLTATNDNGVTVDLDRGPTINLPAAYLDAGHLTHAYATTIHKAQGMTCDRTLVLGSGALFQEAAYTALSRGRTENHLYLVAPETPDVDVGHGIYGARDEPLDGLVSALGHSNQKQLAIDQITPPSPVQIQAPDVQDFGIDF